MGLLLKSITLVLYGVFNSHTLENESYKYNRSLYLHKRASARSQNGSESPREVTSYNIFIRNLVIGRTSHNLTNKNTPLVRGISSLKTFPYPPPSHPSTATPYLSPSPGPALEYPGSSAMPPSGTINRWLYTCFISCSLQLCWRPRWPRLSPVGRALLTASACPAPMPVFGGTTPCAASTGSGDAGSAVAAAAAAAEAEADARGETGDVALVGEEVAAARAAA